MDETSLDLLGNQLLGDLLNPEFTGGYRAKSQLSPQRETALFGFFLRRVGSRVARRAAGAREASSAMRLAAAEPPLKGSSFSRFTLLRGSALFSEAFTRTLPLVFGWVIRTMRRHAACYYPTHHTLHRICERERVER